MLWNKINIIFSVPHVVLPHSLRQGLGATHSGLINSLLSLYTVISCIKRKLHLLFKT